VLEGGSVDVNGAGLLLTTEECLLSPIQARNPELTREQTRRRGSSEYLGADKRPVWLNNGIAGDDTHGHIDDLARFTDAGSGVIVSEDDPSDPNHEPLRENWERLSASGARAEAAHARAADLRWRAAAGELREFLYREQDVLVPTFNDPNDRVALNTLAECFRTGR
jgi:agmatine deiminase